MESSASELRQWRVGPISVARAQRPGDAESGQHDVQSEAAAGRAGLAGKYSWG
jgi:hypothetical protein